MADIAHGLAGARWNGQTEGPHIFSVAQHSLLTETLARQSPGSDRRIRLACCCMTAPDTSSAT